MDDGAANLTREVERLPGSRKTASGTSDGIKAANQVLADYYRCPPNLLQFLAVPQSVHRRGFFQFGKDILCYGRLSHTDAAGNPDGELVDVLDQVEVETAGVRLPFDASEVIENLRRERYSAHFREEGNVANAFLRKAYYLLRPYLSVPIRRHLQKARLRDWDSIRFPAWPVDITVDRLHQKLLALTMRAQGAEKVPFIWFWPDNFRSCAIVTHDVEGPTGRDFCGRLMDLDESFGFYSSFQVVPENRYSVSKSYLQSIISRGFEVNVHDLKHDGRLYAEHGEFLRRAERINDYIREFGAEGFRSGILYRNADWFDAFEFSYDMSIPNVAHLDPQRGGCCSVMPYFIGKIIELPVTCSQDYTLFNILADYSIDLWKKQIAKVLANYGLISVIVHPDYIMERKAQATYRALLVHLAELRSSGQIWTPLPRDAAAWWRARSKMELVLDDGKWRVEGECSERARVGYASVKGEKMTYSLDS
ncbi:MAG: hypothetical protein ACLQVL_07220 [Terriglobia bacterium]